MSKNAKRFQPARKEPEQRHEDLCWKRDTIIESDPVTMFSLACLRRRISQGKLPSSAYPRLWQATAMHALRRAGISLKESRQLMHA